MVWHTDNRRIQIDKSLGAVIDQYHHLRHPPHTTALPAMGVYAHFYPPPPGEEPKPISWKVRHGCSTHMYACQWTLARPSSNTYKQSKHSNP